MTPPPRWDLRDVFDSPEDPVIETTLTTAFAEAQSLVRDYKGKVADLSADQIRDLLERYERIVQTADKPENYAFLRYTVDVGDPAREGFMRLMRERVLQVANELVWVKLELAQLPMERFAALVTAPEAAPYRHFLENLARAKPHQLSETEERLLADLQQTGRQAFQALFEQEDATKVFDLNGEPRTLESLLNDLSNTDREVRAQAATAIGKGLGDDALRRSFLYTTIIKDKAMTDRYRRYESPEQLRHQVNEISPAAVEALAVAVESYRDLFQRYYTWKAKQLGLEKLAEYDLYAPLATVERTYTFDEARECVLQAFNAFSPKMAEIATLFFENHWIDAEPSAGKQSGAYCQFMTADAHPYVFLNFQGKIGDVLTLAHELGHAIHTMLARPCGELQFTTPLTLAETASTFSEMLVFEALRHQLTDPKERMAFHASKIEEVFATVFRQINYFRFEQSAHRFVLEHGYAAPEQYQAMWIDATKNLFGEAIDISPGYKHSWSRISHFFDREFYVYAYAFGELITCCLYEESQLHPVGFQEKYLELLSQGGSKSPKDLLAPIGLDPESTATWIRGLEWIKRLVDETTADTSSHETAAS